MAQDLLLKQIDQNGSFDLQIGEQDFKTVKGLETTIAVLLFTDARAAPEEVNDRTRRRGWVGNILRSTELGGMLWLSAQVKNTQEIRNRIVQWAEGSLQPLIDDGLASEIVATVEQTDNRAIKLTIEITVKQGTVKKIDYWINTDLGNLTNAD